MVVHVEKVVNVYHVHARIAPTLPTFNIHFHYCYLLTLQVPTVITRRILFLSFFMMNVHKTSPYVLTKAPFANVVLLFNTLFIMHLKKTYKCYIARYEYSEEVYNL